MPQKYTRKNNREKTPIDVLKRAAGALRQSGKPQQSPRKFNVNKTALKRFVNQMSIDKNTAKKSDYKGVGDSHYIFSAKMEENLAKHIKSLSSMFYGLSTNKCRQLTFEFAIQNNITIPDNREKIEKQVLTGSYHLSLNMDYMCESLKQHLWHVQRHLIGPLYKFFDQSSDFYDR